MPPGAGAAQAVSRRQFALSCGGGRRRCGPSATAFSLRPAELPLLPAVSVPDHGTVEDGGLASGMVQDFSDQLAHTKISSGSLVVIPLRDTIENGVNTVERARGRLGASHVVQGRTEQKDGQFRVEGVITDARTRVEVSRFSAAYSRSTLARAPAALAGAVINAPRLKARLPAEGVPPKHIRHMREAVLQPPRQPQRRSGDHGIAEGGTPRSAFRLTARGPGRGVLGHVQEHGRHALAR
jgi:hypothetical protein